MTGHDEGAVPVLRLTAGALSKVRELRSDEPDPGSLALWVEVSGVVEGAYSYDMYFQAESEIRPGDWSGRQEDLTVVVPAESATQMLGSVLDVNLLSGGMAIRNPNVPPVRTSPGIGGPVADLSGDVAQRVVQVLDRQINPAIAAHGGRADLVAVEDDVAYLRLSGGCAGCGMVAVTLGQGIEVAIKESVPEIARIVDVTDHAAGTNPYYEPDKK